ncbi:MAG TPA: hypothetical protein VE136_17710 [Anaerolineales bacterium]|nr:hypothetical protein [Anaerolineales bacterium]
MRAFLARPWPPPSRIGSLPPFQTSNPPSRNAFRNGLETLAPYHIRQRRIVVFYYIFPNGRFFPRITRLLAAIWVAYTLSWIYFPELVPPSNHIITTPRQMILGLVFFIWLGSGASAQLYRYRRFKNPVERLETKWIVFGTSAAAAGTVITFSPPMFFPLLRTPGPAMVIYVMLAFWWS